MIDPTNIHAIQDHENDQRHLSAQQRKEDERVWAWLMSGPQGRRVVYTLLERCGVYQNSYTGEIAGTSFNEGRRSVGLELMTKVIAASPENYMTMLGEQLDDRK